MKRISGKLLISVLLGIFMFAGGAWAEPYVATVYDAWTFLRGGKAAYDAAGFGNLNIYVGDTRGKIETDDSTSGTFTITGAGSYTVRSVNGIIEDAPNPFPLIAQEYGDNWVTFHPAVDGNSVWFTREAETGLPGSLITWSHPSYGDDVRTFEVPTHRPVQQQLAEFVPYVEYVLDPEGRISEILWRFVTSDATDTPVPAPFDGQLWSIWVTTKYPSKIDLEFSSFSDYNFSEGTQLFGSSVLPFPIAPADIEAVHVMFKAPAEDGSETFYNWDFVALTPRVEAMYRSDGALFDGRSVYDEAKFSHIRLAIVENHTDNTLIGETGSLTVRGGRYTVTTDAGIGSTGTDIDSVSDTEKTFDLSLESTSNDNYVGHWPSVDGEFILFTGEAETGLNGQEVVWKHPAYGEDVEYSCTLPDFRKTSEQLSFVPYVEYETSGNRITGLKWRFVSSDNPDEPVPAQFPGRVRDIRIYDSYDNFAWDTGYPIYVDWKEDLPSFNVGDIVEGSFSISDYRNRPPIEVTAVRLVRVRFYDTSDGENPAIMYDWRFLPVAQPTTVVNHRSMAHFANVDGQWKTVYDNARFRRINFYVDDARAKLAGDSGTGTFTIKNGSYALIDADTPTDEILGTVTNADRAFLLNYYFESEDYTEFLPWDNGKFLAFGGTGVENGLSGKTVEWTHPTYGETVHSFVIPKFRSTADLLNEFAPYIEPVVSGDVLIGVNWKFVAAADPAGIATAPVSGGVGTIRVDHSGSESPFRWTSGGAYFEAESEPSSTATFDTSFPIASVTRIRLNFYLQESSQVSPYAWDFYPVSADSVPEPSPDPDPTPEPNPDPGPGPTPTPDPEPTDPTAPPTVPDTTTTAVVPATENPGRHFSLSIVAAGGVPIPNNVQFHFWFIVEISSSAGIRAADTSAYVGPFVARSVTSASGATTLDIDADNLKKPDGSKGSVPAGSYRVKFADSETGQKYVGTTPVAVTIEETATVPDRPVNPNPSPSSQGGGGCNAGYGTIGLLLLTGVALRRRRIR